MEHIQPILDFIVAIKWPLMILILLYIFKDKNT